MKFLERDEPSYLRNNHVVIEFKENLLKKFANSFKKKKNDEIVEQKENIKIDEPIELQTLFVIKKELNPQ